MVFKIRQLAKKQEFITGPISLITNPAHIARSRIEKTISHNAVDFHGTVLDFGCGSKPYETLFKNVEEYVGIDIEQSGHDHRYSKVDFFYDGKTIPFPDEYFDGVVCFEVLEHVFNVEEVLAEIRRVLKPKGRFLISLPFAWGEHEVPYDFARYTSFGIVHVISQSGFRVVEATKTGTSVLAISQLFISYVNEVVNKTPAPIRLFLKAIITLPLNLSALMLDKILPKSQTVYCNNIVLSEKI